MYERLIYWYTHYHYKINRPNISSDFRGHTGNAHLDLIETTPSGRIKQITARSAKAYTQITEGRVGKLTSSTRWSRDLYCERGLVSTVYHIRWCDWFLMLWTDLAITENNIIKKAGIDMVKQYEYLCKGLLYWATQWQIIWHRSCNIT